MNILSEPTGKEMGIEGKDDWRYADLPNLTEEYFNKYVEILGEENIYWITKAARTWDDGVTTYRGQHLISPEGIARGAAYAKENKT